MLVPELDSNAGWIGWIQFLLAVLLIVPRPPPLFAARLLGRIVPSLVGHQPPIGLESTTTLFIQVLDVGLIVPLTFLGLTRVGKEVKEEHTASS